MASDIIPVGGGRLFLAGEIVLPAMIVNAGERAVRRFVEFFTATIRNANTRTAYAHAVGQFMAWCDEKKLSLGELEPIAVATYVEWLTAQRSAPTVKQHLAAIKMLFDWLVTGQILPTNPAASVRGPKHVVKKGKTLVLSAEQARQLIDSIPIVEEDEETKVRTILLVGLRDRALIGAMVFSFARVSAVANMDVEDYWQNGKRCWLRLHEKGGKHHEVPAHHTAEAYLDAYLHAAGIAVEGKTPLFRSAIGGTDRLSANRMSRKDALRMIKRRTKKAGLPARVCCHTFRATGITAYLENKGTIEKAQAIAAHESPRTTKLYDRTSDEITLDEIERIVI
jgi:integrase/recombinase XerD